MDLKYNDIYDNSMGEIAFKFDINSNKYSIPNEDIYGHGSSSIHVFTCINDVKKVNQMYEISYNAIWSSSFGAGDSYDLFSSYEDAKINKNAIMKSNEFDSLSVSTDYEKECNEYLFTDKGLKNKSNTFKVKVSVDDFSKIISYERVK